MPGSASLLPWRRRTKRPATRAEVQPLRALSLERLAGLLPPGTTQRSPCRWQKLSDRRRVMHRWGAVAAPRYAQAFEAHTKMTQYRKRSPLTNLRYNNSLTGSNACATMALMSRAFLLSQSLMAGRVSLTLSHRLSTVHPLAPHFPQAWPGSTMHPSRPDVVLACLRTATLEPHVKCRSSAAPRLPAQPAPPSGRQSSAGNPPSRRRWAAPPGPGCRRDEACAFRQ